MTTRILFLISRFLDGGIDTVLTEYLYVLSQRKDISITLSISLSMGDKLEVFIQRLPENVKVCHLVTNPLLTAYRRRAKAVGKNKLLGFFDELLFNPLRRMCYRRGINRLAKDADAVIDFDLCHSSYMRQAWKAVKIGYFHFSFKKEAERNPRRMSRLSQKIDAYDRIVLISKGMLDEAEALWPSKKNCFVKIYNGVDAGRLKSLSSAPLPEEWQHRDFWVCVERLEESQKDITTLLKALALAKQEYASATPQTHRPLPTLCIIGKGKDQSRLMSLAQSLHLGDDDVRFMGFMSNPYPWMKHARALVHSAHFEGLPTVLIEALVMGKTIISTDSPTGPREILADGKAGVLVPVGDIRAMAQALLDNLSADSHGSPSSEAIRRQQELFLPETACDALLGIVKK